MTENFSDCEYEYKRVSNLYDKLNKPDENDINQNIVKEIYNSRIRSDNNLNSLKDFLIRYINDNKTIRNKKYLLTFEGLVNIITESLDTQAKINESEFNKEKINEITQEFIDKLNKSILDLENVNPNYENCKLFTINSKDVENKKNAIEINNKIFADRISKKKESSKDIAYKSYHSSIKKQNYNSNNNKFVNNNKVNLNNKTMLSKKQFRNYDCKQNKNEEDGKSNILKNNSKPNHTLKDLLIKRKHNSLVCNTHNNYNNLTINNNNQSICSSNKINKEINNEIINNIKNCKKTTECAIVNNFEKAQKAQKIRSNLSMETGRKNKNETMSPKEKELKAFFSLVKNKFHKKIDYNNSDDKSAYSKTFKTNCNNDIEENEKVNSTITNSRYKNILNLKNRNINTINQNLYSSEGLRNSSLCATKANIIEDNLSISQYKVKKTVIGTCPKPSGFANHLLENAYKYLNQFQKISSSRGKRKINK